jgi:DNA-directed RNA polymerase specialized sigma24 family protein
MNEKQPNNHEEQDNIDKLVLSYQDGNEEAGLELLRIYGADPSVKNLNLYVGKFYKLIRYGKIDFKDYDSRAFMSCFFPGAERAAILQSYQYKKTKEDVVRKLGQIVEAMKVIEDEDLKQELRILFLQQAKRYEKKNRTFGAYLNNSYRFAVANYIIKLMKMEEPYVKLTREMLRIADDRLKDDDANVDVQDSIFAKSPMIHMEEDLGNSWVRGLTCGEEFKELTPLQRLIIKLNYFDGWSDGRIADKMGIHINTIFRQRTKAGKIVRETVERLKQEGYYR